MIIIVGSKYSYRPYYDDVTVNVRELAKEFLKLPGFLYKRIC